MLLGLDTGFFIRLKEKNSEALATWDAIINQSHEARVSVFLSLHELLVHFYRLGKSEEGKTLVSLLKMLGNVEFVPVSEEIAEKSAGYRHGLGLATVDSVILTSLVEANCDFVYTTDTYWQIAEKQNLTKMKVL